MASSTIPASFINSDGFDYPSRSHCNLRHRQRQLDRCRYLASNGTRHRDEQIACLEDLPRLRHFAIWPGLPDGSGTLQKDARGGLTDSGAVQLLHQCQRLQDISLSAACLSDQVTGRIISDSRFESVGINRHPAFGGDTPAFALSLNRETGTRTSPKFAKYNCPSELVFVGSK